MGSEKRKLAGWRSTWTKTDDDVLPGRRGGKLPLGMPQGSALAGIAGVVLIAIVAASTLFGGAKGDSGRRGTSAAATQGPAPTAAIRAEGATGAQAGPAGAQAGPATLGQPGAPAGAAPGSSPQAKPGRIGGEPPRPQSERPVETTAATGPTTAATPPPAAGAAPTTATTRRTNAEPETTSPQGATGEPTCVASVDDPNPPRASTVTVLVTSNVPAADFTVTATYWATTVSKIATTDASGNGSVGVPTGTRADRVSVIVKISDKTTCETTFTPR